MSSSRQQQQRTTTSRILLVLFLVAVASKQRNSVSASSQQLRRNRDLQSTSSSNVFGAAAPAAASNNSTGRIVGGSPTTDFSWFATDPRRSCGASLIHPSIVVTAAHCVEHFYKTGRIVLGASSRSEVERQAGHLIDREIIHPGYNPKTLENDIALLKLRQPVYGIQPIPWTIDRQTPPAGREHVIMGFGSIYQFGPSSSSLLKATVKSVSDSECQKIYPSRVHLDSMMCAVGLKVPGTTAIRTDSCEGDAGGPLIHINSYKQSILVGIVSWGEGCARDRFAGVYTRVGIYDKWISENICACDPSKRCSSKNLKNPQCGNEFGTAHDHKPKDYGKFDGRHPDHVTGGLFSKYGMKS